MFLKKYNIFIYIFLLLIFILLFIPVTAAAQETEREPRLNFNGITNDQFIGQAGVLYPFRNTEDSLWFTDFRYRMSEDDVDEWNLGLGYRRKIDTAENHIAGIYAFKDRREEHDHYWDMWTVGGEILTDQWDFRLNGYITENDRVLAGNTGGLEVNSDQVLVYDPGNDIYYKSMNGLDVEIGKRFTETDTIFKNIGIYAKLFRFFESDTPTMTGRQIRINKQFGNRDKITWKIGAQWRDDNIRGSETEATFAVSIPFGKGEAAANSKDKTPSEIVETRMTEQPERDLDVVVGEAEVENERSGEKIPVENPAIDEDIKVWYVKQGADGDGSKDSPISISNAFGENSEVDPGDIFVLKGDYNIEEKAGVISGDILLPITLDSYQQFISNNNDGGAIVKNPSGKGNLLFRPDIDDPGVINIKTQLSIGLNVLKAAKKGNVVSGIVFNLENNHGVETDLDIYKDIKINNNSFRVKNSNPEAEYPTYGILVKDNEELDPEKQEEFESELKEIYTENNEFINFENDNDKEVIVEPVEPI